MYICKFSKFTHFLLSRFYSHTFTLMHPPIHLPTQTHTLSIYLTHTFTHTPHTGFAVAISIIFGSILSTFIFDFNLSAQFAFGASLVVGAVFLYGRPVTPSKTVLKSAEDPDALKIDEKGSK
jgi:hypothetical protein